MRQLSKRWSGTKRLSEVHIPFCCVTKIILLLSNIDFTASTMLERFSNESTGQSLERVLKKLSTQKATEILAVCVDSLYVVPFAKFPSDPGTTTAITYICFGVFRCLPSSYVPFIRLEVSAVSQPPRSTTYSSRKSLNRGQHASPCASSIGSPKLCSCSYTRQ